MSFLEKKFHSRIIWIFCTFFIANLAWADDCKDAVVNWEKSAAAEASIHEAQHKLRMQWIEDVTAIGQKDVHGPLSSGDIRLLTAAKAALDKAANEHAKTLKQLAEARQVITKSCSADCARSVENINQLMTIMEAINGDAAPMEADILKFFSQNKINDGESLWARSRVVYHKTWQGRISLEALQKKLKTDCTA
ncbi:MAG: hypothetical protein AAF512_09470 [Pseudomonadota bacterium]